MNLQNLWKSKLRNWLRINSQKLGVFFRKIRVYFALTILTAIVIISLTNCSTQTLSPLRIGTNLWTGYETLYLARNLGYYDPKAIRLVDYPSGTEEVRAYRHREIEGAGLSIDQALVLAATQENIKIIAIMDISQGGDVILGKPDLANMQSLKGKKVGVEATSLGAFFIIRALEKNGMSPEDIEIVSLEISEQEEAYKQGKVDAIVTFGPVRSKLLEAGAKVLFDSSQIPGEIVDTLVVNTEAITNFPESIQALVNGHFRALNYLKKDPQDAAIRMAKRTQVTPQQILNALQGLRQPNLEENLKLLDQSDPSLRNAMNKLVQIMMAKNLLPKAIDPTQILETRFIKNAQL